LIRSGKMRESSNAIDPWIQTIELLSVLCRVAAPGMNRPLAPTGEQRSKIRRYPPSTENRHVSVELIERIDAWTATISWRDATRCCYVDQVWRASRSRVKGVCAMSGRVIHLNDDVFRPSRGRAIPLNGRAMILTVMLDDLEHVGQKSCPDRCPEDEFA
jgi:hypothetical protein